jgi:excinuclease ABC subunit C
MVVAVDGEIRRDQYRIFKINDIEGSDDPGMLKRVLERRFDKKNKGKYPNNPNIVLIDGGKSQLSTLIPLMGDIIPKTVHLLGISKGKRLKRKGSRQVDEFWLVINKAGDIKRVEITNNSILVDLRDEAHRFAILHHRKARIRSSKTSELDSISGVGPKRRKALLKHFKNIQEIKKASEEEINKVVNNKKVSKDIYRYFRRK